MRKPWDISGHDLELWASRIEAAAMLPSLVRRLLFATAPRASIEMRADGGTRLSGWDGVVQAREATSFCPAGISVWELSVEQKPKRKLDKDLAKRTAAPPLPVRPKATTYIAVTARRFEDKLRWANEKRALRDWADVQVIDADDLARWLEQAPAVARWFAEELGKPVADLRDVEALLEAWRLRTSPPLPWALVLAGDERARQAGELLGWLDQPPTRPLLVRGETREEALLFAAAALREQPSAEPWLARALIVESADALRWALSVQTAEPLVVLAAFEGADPGQIAAARAHGILAGDRSTPELPGATLELAPIPWNPMVQGLIKAGFKEEQAWRRVRDADGSLSKLQALYGYIELPDWARGLPAPEILALLLAGGWTPTNEADRQVLQRLGGEPDRVDQLCVELARRGDVKPSDEGWGPNTWRWKAPKTAWEQLADRLTEGQIDRFQAVVIDVLGAPDPTYELPQAEGWSEPVTAHGLSYSGVLRKGLARSLVFLSQSDRRAGDAPQRSRGRDIAASMIYRLFPPERAWKPWASLSGLLLILAEAAPEAFLDVLERSLAQGPQGVAHLLAEEGGSYGATPHVDLLWALEALGWSPEPLMMRRVALALARLAAHDREGSAPGKVVSRPGRSLAKLLHIRCPQSRSSVEDRLRVLELLLKDEDKEVSKIGWDIGLGMLGFLRGMFTPSHQAEDLPWETVDALREVSDEEMSKQREGAATLVLAHAGADALRWTGLLNLILQMPMGLTQQVLDTLEKTRATMIGSTSSIRSALRERLRWGRSRVEKVDPAILDRLSSLLEAFTPDDPIGKHAWLFSHKLHLLPEPVQGGWEEEEKQKNTLRQRAIEEIWPLPDRWDKLTALSRAAEEPSTIGVAIAGADFADEMEEHLLSGPRPPLDAGILRAFFGKRFEIKGEAEGLPWIKQVIVRLLEDKRLEEAVLVARSPLSGVPVWDMIDALGDPLRSAYWKAIHGVSGHHPPESWERATSNLLAAGNLLGALDTARNATDNLSAATAMRVLERLRELPPSERHPTRDFLFDHSIERVLERIEREPSMDPAKILELELAFPAVLSNPSRAHQHLSAALGAHPELFGQLLQAMYRREGAPPLPEGEEAERVRTAAERAYDILSAWESYPGAGLPAEDREAKLEAWASEVLDAASAIGRGGPAASQVAKVLARAPEGPDGLWPCLAARRLLRKNKYPGLRESLEIAQKNRRGVTARGLLEGGDQERVVATSYREAAQQMRDEFPEAATLLDSLARAYDDAAKPWDVKARRQRIEYGEAEEAPAPRPAKAAPAGGPLSRLELRGIGPAPALTLELAPRLNLVTGDNSLGKTLVLDVAWWCLTGSFAQPDRLPRPTVKVRNGKILKSKAAILARAGDHAITGTYSALHERWSMASGQPLAPGLAIYARVDGGFSIWDPIRNVAPSDKDEVDLSKGYHFSQKELWEGLFPKRSTTPLCNGLITDAVRWRSERPRAHELLAEALKALSPPHEKLEFGLPRRFSVREDARDHPVLLLSYGPIFAVHASSAVQRILGLAYALVWAVTEIQAAASVAGLAPIPSVTMLIDEVEAHLHPKWQRTILRALLKIVDKIAPEAQVQIVVTTHAPLVLASVEQPFDPSTDAFFDFNLTTAEDGEGEATPTPVVKKEPWIIRGDVNAWLGSEVFDHTEPRSPDAEKAMKAAKAALDNPDTDRKQGRKVHRVLRRALREIDPFWLRFRYLAEKRGWLP